jgi:hypothetical protein
VSKIRLAATFSGVFSFLAFSITFAATWQSGFHPFLGLADSPTTTPGLKATSSMPNMFDRLAPPPTVYPPTQADSGQQTYYLVCMTCHGDRGQGLTDEFRALIGTPDSNCWQSHCHAYNHPPEGFVLPHVVPPVVGGVMRERFTTAQQLHDFIAVNMPYQAPGSLSPSDYWNLTAYLLRANGVAVRVPLLDAQTATQIFLTEPAPQLPAKPLSLPVAVLIGVVLILLLIVLIRINRPR